MYIHVCIYIYIYINDVYTHGYITTSYRNIHVPATPRPAAPGEEAPPPRSGENCVYVCMNTYTYINK